MHTLVLNSARRVMENVVEVEAVEDFGILASHFLEFPGVQCLARVDDVRGATLTVRVGFKNKPCAEHFIAKVNHFILTEDVNRRTIMVFFSPNSIAVNVREYFVSQYGCLEYFVPRDQLHGLSYALLAFWHHLAADRALSEESDTIYRAGRVADFQGEKVLCDVCGRSIASGFERENSNADLCKVLLLVLLPIYYNVLSLCNITIIFFFFFQE